MTHVLDFVGNPLTSDGKVSTAFHQHETARQSRIGHPIASALRNMLLGWQEYAKVHKNRYEESIGKDYFIGPHWASVGLAIKCLLDGETGGFDCGSLAANITNIIEENGFKTDGYSLLENKE